MRVLYLTKYTRKGASSRLRSYQYFPFLKKEGFKITVKPLFDDQYLEFLYNEKNTFFKILISYSKRLLILFTLKKYDCIIIEKELFPYLPSIFERIIKTIGIKYIVDYDDAIFHNYDLNKSKLVRFFLKHKIDNVMKWSTCVIAGNNYLATRAKEAGAKKIEIIPTVINNKNYYFKKKVLEDPFVVGWIGSPSTFKYLKQLENVLNNLVEKYKIAIHIIGAKDTLDVGTKIKYINWQEETEIREIQKFDVGIMPLENTPWELGKCAYKLIQYMGCGIPVVASPVGMNTEVVKHNWNGFLAENDNEWYIAIERLIVDRTLKNQLGINGQKLVENDFILKKYNYLYKRIILAN